MEFNVYAKLTLGRIFQLHDHGNRRAGDLKYDMFFVGVFHTQVAVAYLGRFG